MSEKTKDAIAAAMSFEAPTQCEIERLWLDEAEHRMQELLEGKVKTVSADDVFKRAVLQLS